MGKFCLLGYVQFPLAYQVDGTMYVHIANNKPITYSPPLVPVTNTRCAEMIARISQCPKTLEMQHRYPYRPSLSIYNPSPSCSFRTNQTFRQKCEYSSQSSKDRAYHNEEVIQDTFTGADILSKDFEVKEDG